MTVQGAVALAPAEGRPAHVNAIIQKAATAWLSNEEIQQLLRSVAASSLPISTAAPDQPPGGTLFLFNKKETRYFRQDGHAWKLREGAGRSRPVNESHEKLMIGTTKVLNCYYCSSRIDDLKRRSYWMLKCPQSAPHYVLVHYLNAPGKGEAGADAQLSGAGGEEGGAGGGGGPVNRRGVLDDIDWGLVSERVGTRSNVQCLDKWYNQVSSSMVARGEWGSGDDRRLLRSVYAGVIAGATHDFELDWSQLVKGRGPQQARRRWRLMVKVVPDHRDMEFAGLVDALVDRYLPKLKQQAAAAAEQEQQQRGKGQQGEA